MTRRLLLGLWLTLVLGLVAVVPGMAADGQWKLAGDGSCYFDPEGDGPNQCGGRWKLAVEGDPNSCYFDGQDAGPDQCPDPRGL